MTVQQLSLSALVLAISFSSCSKQRIEDELVEYADMNEYLDAKKQEEQKFVIDSAGSGPIIGKEGTHLFGGKDLLMHANGDSVEWPYTITLVELYPAYDMMYWQIPTVAGGNMLETRGEIRVKAYKDNEELVLRPGATYGIFMPSDDPLAGMNVYEGTLDGSDWTKDLAYNFTESDSGHVAEIDELGWLNCGQQASDGSGGTVSFTSTVDDLTHVKVFIYAPETRTVMQANSSEYASIPTGTTVDVVCMAIDADGLLYAYNQTTTITGDLTIDVTLAEISDANLTALLAGL